MLTLGNKMCGRRMVRVKHVFDMELDGNGTT